MKQHAGNLLNCVLEYGQPVAKKYLAGLKLGRVIRVIRVNRVMFCPGQVGLTRFIKYPGLT